MTLIDQYITRTTLHALGLILLGLLSLSFFIGVISESYAVGRGDYTLFSAMIYTLGILPSLAYQYFPLAGLLGSMMAFNQLANHRELVVMRASGLSIFRITKPVFILSLSLVIVTFLLGEGIAPTIAHQAQTYKAELKSGGRALSTASGLWLREGGQFIHVGKLLPGGRMENITEYETDDNLRLIASRYANAATYAAGKWQLSDIHANRFKPDHVESVHSPAEAWEIKLNPDWLRVARTAPDEMSLFDLQHYLEYLKKNDLQASNFSILFWSRLLQPFATIIMMIVAIPLLFGPLRQSGTGLKLVFGVLIGFAFYILNHIAGPVGVTWQLSLPIAFLIPPLCFLLLYFYLAKRYG